MNRNRNRARRRLTRYQRWVLWSCEEDGAASLVGLSSWGYDAARADPSALRWPHEPPPTDADAFLALAARDLAGLVRQGLIELRRDHPPADPRRGRAVVAVEAGTARAIAALVCRAPDASCPGAFADAPAGGLGRVEACLTREGRRALSE